MARSTGTAQDLADEQEETERSERRAMLQTIINRMEQSKGRRRRMATMYFFLGGFLLILSPVGYTVSSGSLAPWVLLGMLAYSAISVAAGFMLFSTNDLDVRIRQAQDEVDLLEVGGSPERRAEKRFKLHQAELKRYYDQTLRQGGIIFFVGLFLIAVGLFIVGWSLYLVFAQNSKASLPEQIVLASLGAVGGILSNFIAVIYLKMHAATIRSLADFHNRLVFTHHLHFGDFLVTKINQTSLREATLATIAIRLAHSGRDFPAQASPLAEPDTAAPSQEG